MKIALLAPFEESVPPEKYGGTELIVYHLAQLLPKMGHETYLFATADSKTNSELIPTFPRAIRKEKIAEDIKTRDSLKYIGVAKVVEELKKRKIDIIHNHIGWRFLPFASLFECPTVTTLHGPLDIPYQQFIYGRFKELPFVSISNSQRKPFQKLNYAATVYNGIDLNQFKFNEEPKGDYLAFLGRMSPEKGPKQAIEVAKRSGIKLKMAGKIDAVDKEYFEKEIKPLIDGKQVEFIGEIGSEERDGFLGNAIALLAPLQWEEPFGLFLIEPQACGTPVIALKRGAAPEVIKHGKTGFVVEMLDEMIIAVKKIDTIKRKECRKWIEENFTAERMVKDYEKVYQKLIK